MTTQQAEIISQIQPPAPANDFVTKTIAMTREEWRAIESACEDMSMESPCFGQYERSRLVDFNKSSFFASAWDRLKKAIQ